MRTHSSVPLAMAVAFAAVVIFSGLRRPLTAGDTTQGNPLFFAFENAFRDGKVRSDAEKAAMLKALGYDGFSASGSPATALATIRSGEIAAFEKEGLKVFNTYLVLSIDSANARPDASLQALVRRLAGHDSALWISIKEVTLDGVKLKPSSPEGDAAVVPFLRELADLGRPGGVRIAVYHHTWHWTERPEDTVRLAVKAGRANVGATFNLCHWLKAVGDQDPRPMLKEALPHLFFVSINGADRGDTRSMGWDRLVQPLGRGSYDVGALLRTLRELGYAGPIGFQGFGIKGDSREILSESIVAWRRLQSR